MYIGSMKKLTCTINGKSNKTGDHQVLYGTKTEVTRTLYPNRFVCMQSRKYEKIKPNYKSIIKNSR